jgi:hypothetical protein
MDFAELQEFLEYMGADRSLALSGTQDAESLDFLSSFTNKCKRSTYHKLLLAADAERQCREYDMERT